MGRPITGGPFREREDAYEWLSIGIMGGLMFGFLLGLALTAACS
ncbi:hypothetical protein [Terriglobus sp. RCC_193]